MPHLVIAKLLTKSAARKPSTRLYPAEKRAPPKGARGRLVMKQIETCVFCGVCGKKCPTRAIAVKRTDKTWELDRLKCIVCGECVEICPKDCLAMEGEHATAFVAKKIETHVQKPKPAASDPT
ncbi:MAG: 4Fe-4S binding protein [Verrucomicrobiae bacterium]|nr:4Fe-4S binding protein [Verrucomicrobiae bacterium]